MYNFDRIITTRFPNVKIEQIGYVKGYATTDFVIYVQHKNIDHIVKFSIDNRLNDRFNDEKTITIVREFSNSLSKLMCSILRDTSARLGKSLAFSSKKSRGNWRK